MQAKNEKITLTGSERLFERDLSVYEKLCENQDLNSNPSSSGNDTDLAVWIDVENVQKGKLYNQK